ncbi:MAG TPA: histidine kinase [Flavisolibacter sp.]|jgi:sensor histidine kinase YesM|nr:histidine kinase [Flavisolibacter sp.]
MKWFRNYFFPMFFGLLVYLGIRLVNDARSEEQFWDRSWYQNTLEILFSMGIGILAVHLMARVVDRFNAAAYKPTWRHILKEFGTISLYCLVLFNPLLYFLHFLIHDPVGLDDFIIANVMVLLFTLLYYAIARGNRLIHSYIEQQTQLEKIRSEHLQTELKFLKAQYHPHFLFNALNTIYFQMDESVPAAKQTIERFSELLRYQLYDQQQQVPVQQELRYLESFIHLQQARASERLELTVFLDPALQLQRIYPLLLLPLVENAFKYVGGTYQIGIEAHVQNQQLLFKVVNSIPKDVPQKERGIGMENLRRRLAILYPEQHRFEVQKTPEQFTALLQIPLS